MDVLIYFRREETEFRKRFGLAPDRERYSVDPESDLTEGVAEAILPLTESAYLRFFEQVEIGEGGGVRRTKYSYVLVAGGEHIHSWEPDRTHGEMPVHEHLGRSRDPRPGKPLSFEEALVESWVLLSELPRTWPASEP